MFLSIIWSSSGMCNTMFRHINVSNVSMYLTFVFYVLEDDHLAGRNMQIFTVYVKLILMYLLTFVVTYIYILGQYINILYVLLYWPDDGLLRPKILANSRNNKIKR
jgi:hypothetical protein